MLNPNRILPRLVAGVAITVAGAQVVLSAHQARPEPAVAEAVLMAHPVLHHVIDAAPTPAASLAAPASGAVAAPSRLAGGSGSTASRPAPIQAASAQQALINADRAAAGLPP